jgi:hypothetical protein
MTQDNHNITPDDLRQQADARNEAMARAVKNTPRIISVSEMCSMDSDSEDAYIEDRRNAARDRG